MEVTVHMPLMALGRKSSFTSGDRSSDGNTMNPIGFGVDWHSPVIGGHFQEIKDEDLT